MKKIIKIIVLIFQILILVLIVGLNYWHYFNNEFNYFWVPFLTIGLSILGLFLSGKALRSAAKITETVTKDLNPDLGKVLDKIKPEHIEHEAKKPIDVFTKVSIGMIFVFGLFLCLSIYSYWKHSDANENYVYVYNTLDDNTAKIGSQKRWWPDQYQVIKKIRKSYKLDYWRKVDGVKVYVKGVAYINISDFTIKYTESTKYVRKLLNTNKEKYLFVSASAILEKRKYCKSNVEIDIGIELKVRF